jgi:RNA polymerase sigma factor (sigma-70 family)
MPIRLSRNTARELHGLLQHGSLGTWTDGQLMAQFLSEGEAREAAFRALLVRHGPMVLGVCRRILDDPHAAEDAFQTTFLVLVKKAGTLKDTDLLTNWLYGVALRVARKAKSATARRKVAEHSIPEPLRREGDADQSELRAVIDEEISRLPEHFRVPLVLCHLQGMRHQEVARKLGCPVGTVESRLSRARDQLRSRLARRGLSPTAGVMAGVLMPSDARSAIFPLVDSTARAAISAAAVGGGTRAGALLTAASRLLAMRTLRSSAAGLAAAWVISAGASLVGVVGMDIDRVREAPASRDEMTEVRANPVPAKTREVIAPQTLETPESGMVDEPRRLPGVIAAPLDDINIDGRLGDWPKNLVSHPIRHRLLTDGGWDPGTPDERLDFDASFMVGYNAKSGLIYLAVVVRDRDLVVGEGNVGQTDAVEIYVDGLFSDRTIPNPSKDWRTALSAAKMPVLQYVGLPSPVPAYGDPDEANPALMYGEIAKTSTDMAYHRSGGVTTYEWSVQAFDHYPDRPTILVPGKRLGFDVAVVDRDPDRKRASFTTWGTPPTRFKGFDAGLLGELLLDRSP